MIVFDLKFNNNAYHCSKNQHKELAYEQWQNSFFSIDGFHSYVRIQSQRKKIQWKLQDSNLHCMESFSVHGICSAYGKRKSQRFGCLPECYEAQTLPYGLQRQNSSKYYSLQQRKSGLENFCEFRSFFNSENKQTLFGRRVRYRTVRNSLCSRFFYNRPLPFTFSMGKISKEKGCCQVTHIIKFERQYSLIYQNYRRESSRCEYPRRITCGARIILCDGSRLFRFYQAFQNESVSVIFCNPFQNKFFISKSLFPFGRQINWSAMRPNRSSNRNSYCKKISGTSKTSQIPRRRKKQNISISDKQFFRGRIDHSQTLQMSVANRAFFQMDINNI